MKEYKRLTIKLKKYPTVELNRLRELEDDIEEGRLVKLPCKLNDKIYYVNDYGKDIYGNHIYEVEEGYISIFWIFRDGNITYEVVKESGSIDTEEGSLLDNGFYLTKAEAEAKIKELKEV